MKLASKAIMSLTKKMLITFFYIFQTYVAGSWLTIADLSVLASITQLEAMDYKLTGYRLMVVYTFFQNFISSPCNDF